MNDTDENIREELAADGSLSGVEEDIPNESYPFDVEKVSISNKKMVLSNILRRLERGLIHAALLQRRENLWDIVKKSRLIESLMLKIPLPLFYAALNEDDKLFIVDGLQRLNAIKGFVLKKEYKLNSLEFFKEFEGLGFDELPERMQIRINETELDFVIIGPESPEEVQRNIFKRLNTGGLPLTEQEIRHALYSGPATDLLQELVETEIFKIAVDNCINDSRMAAQELILRFLSFSILGISEYKKDEEMDIFLSDTMQIINRIIAPKSYMKKNLLPSCDRQTMNNDINELRAKFIKAMQRAKDLFNNCAFRITTPIRYSKDKIRSPINKSLFEAWSIILSNMNDKDFEQLKKNKEILHEKLESEFGNKDSLLRNYVSKYSLKVASVKGRYEILETMISSILKEEI